MESENPLERRINGIDVFLGKEELEMKREAEMLYSEAYGLPYRSNDPKIEERRLIEIGACVLNRIFYGQGYESVRTIDF